MTSLNGRQIVLFFLGISLVIVFPFYDRIIFSLYGDDQINSQDYLKHIFIFTAKGNVSYNQLNEEVFKFFGYEITHPVTIPIPTLRKINITSCKILETSVDSGDPTTPSLLDKYTLQGFSLYSKREIRGENKERKGSFWEKINKWINCEPRSFVSYGEYGMSLVHAFHHYNISGLCIAIFNSGTPWVEALALRYNVVSVLEELNEINNNYKGTTKIRLINQKELEDNFTNYVGTMDSVISFATIQGFKRNKEKEDPFSDVLDVQRFRCLLKTNGILYLAVLRGQDHVAFNSHRIYGRIRLAILFTGFELLATFRGDYPHPITIKSDDFDGKVLANGFEKDLFVLRKLSN